LIPAPETLEQKISRMTVEIVESVMAGLLRAGLFRNAGPNGNGSTAKLAENRVERRKRKKPPAVESTPLGERRWLTVKETASRYPFTEGALRHMIFVAEGRVKSELPSDGFINCIVRPGGRRVRIDAQALEAWIAAKARGAA
jgi:hypothetical protein